MNAPSLVVLESTTESSEVRHSPHSRRARTSLVTVASLFGSVPARPVESGLPSTAAPVSFARFGAFFMPGPPDQWRGGFQPPAIQVGQRCGQGAGQRDSFPMQPSSATFAVCVVGRRPPLASSPQGASRSPFALSCPCRFAIARAVFDGTERMTLDIRGRQWFPRWPVHLAPTQHLCNVLGNVQ